MEITKAPPQAIPNGPLSLLLLVLPSLTFFHFSYPSAGKRKVVKKSGSDGEKQGNLIRWIRAGAPTPSCVCPHAFDSREQTGLLWEVRLFRVPLLWVNRIYWNFSPRKGEPPRKPPRKFLLFPCKPEGKVFFPHLIRIRCWQSHHLCHVLGVALQLTKCSGN